MPSWIEIVDDTAEYITINTDIDPPQSAFITIRYYNEFPLTSVPGDNEKYYVDFPIQITIKPAAETVNLEQNYEDLKSC